MSLLRSLFARQPTFVTTFITAAVSLAIAYGAPIPTEAKTPIITILVALATLFLQQTVAAPATVAAVATQAATSTVAKLDDATVGAVGDVTEAAGHIVKDTVKGVVGAVGGLTGTLAKEAL